MSDFPINLLVQSESFIEKKLAGRKSTRMDAKTQMGVS